MALYSVRGSIVVSIPACHAGNRGSIPRRGVTSFLSSSLYITKQSIHSYHLMPLFFDVV